MNPICTDHVSTLLLTCTASADFLDKEDLSDRAQLVGDPIYDVFVYYSEKQTATDWGDLLDLEGQPVATPEVFYYLSCHWEENTATDESLTEILEAMNCLAAPKIYPVHPLNKVRVARICMGNGLQNIILNQLEPAVGVSNLHCSGEACPKNRYPFWQLVAGDLFRQQAMRHHV